MEQIKIKMQPEIFLEIILIKYNQKYIDADMFRCPLEQFSCRWNFISNKCRLFY